MSRTCPRCGSGLSSYQLQETETVVCETCGYVGVEVDHTGEHPSTESWADALERFNES